MTNKVELEREKMSIHGNNTQTSLCQETMSMTYRTVMIFEPVDTRSDIIILTHWQY